MIAFEITLNGKTVCLAGAEDLSVLTANVSAVGKLGSKTIPARPDETTGDVIEVRVLETEQADRPTSRTKARKQRG